MGASLAAATARKCVMVSRIGFIHHGRQHHEAIDSGLPSGSRKAACFGRRALGDAGENRDATLDMRYRRAHNGKFFFVIERTVFAHGAEKDDALNTSGEQSVQVPSCARHIESAVGMKLRGNGRKNALPIDLHGSTPKSASIPVAQDKPSLWRIKLKNCFTCRASRQGSTWVFLQSLAAELIHLPDESAGVLNLELPCWSEVEHG